VAERRITHTTQIRGAEAILAGFEPPKDYTPLGVRLSRITQMAAEQCEFDEGADRFALFLRYMQMWKGERGQQFRESFGDDDAREKFFDIIGGRQGLERGVKTINEWLTRVGWKDSMLTAEELEKLVFDEGLKQEKS